MKPFVAALACVVCFGSVGCAPTTAGVAVESPAAVAPAAGHWVWTDSAGWVWVPRDTVAVDFQGGPQAWLYVAGTGWGWYGSPWGYGPYVHGAWRSTWHPAAWHEHARVVAHPMVMPMHAHRGGGFHGHRR